MHTTLPPFFWPIGTGTEPAGRVPAQQILGHDGSRYLVVLADSSIGSIDPASVLVTTRFVNSSSHQFTACLEALESRRAEIEQGSAEEALLAIGWLRHEFNRVDIAALGDQDNWWAALLDHLEDALP